MVQSKSSKRWLQEHFSDPYVQKAQKEGYRSRAAYKLLEIQAKDPLILQGMVVIDLGAAPGSWSQLIARWVGHRGRVLALDILPMDPLPDVEFLQGDFQDEQVLLALLQKLGDAQVDWVVSDMAPNMSGMDAVDQPRSMYLAELALDFAQQVLKPEGAFLVKVFQGTDSENFIRNVRQHFKQVQIRKPKASRSRSREIYLVARGFKKDV